MRVLIVGDDGRTHALGWKIKQSSLAPEVFFAPGNAGTAAGVGTNVSIELHRRRCIRDLVVFAGKNRIDLTIVSPEHLLMWGIVDEFRKHNLPIFGPDREAARVEWSKQFFHQIAETKGIDVAPCQVVTSLRPALNYLKNATMPIVVKCDGLASGKGVKVCRTFEEACETVKAWLHKGPVLIEKFLKGQEASAHTLCDKNGNVLMCDFIKDHKTITHDTFSLNTGGMGAFTPIPGVDPGLKSWVKHSVVYSILDYLVEKVGHPFTGCLFPGLMITTSGASQKVWTLECNGRLGDPETQPLMMHLRTDIVGVFQACFEGHLNLVQLEWEPGFSAVVVLVSGGYPLGYKTGAPIIGLGKNGQLPDTDDAVLFHSGTVSDGEGNFFTSGGRVLTVTARGATLAEALRKIYTILDERKIYFQGMYYRGDIRQEACARESAPASILV